MVEAGRVTAVIDGDISALTSKLAQTRSQATAAASGIESEMKGKLSGGKFGAIGQSIGSDLVGGISGGLGPLGNVAGSVATSLGPVGIVAMAGVAGVVALGAASVQTAAQWQTMMASISKTTGIEGTGLTEMSSTLQQIRMETGATADAISGAVITAGSIGVPTAELAGFAETSLQMASAFGMGADAAAGAMGKIGNVVKPAEMSWVEFANKAGSSVNALADSMATSESEILTGMTHLGATMGLLKPPADTIPAWTALVATVQSLGLSGDAAGEAIQDALNYSLKDAKGAISGMLGKTSEELQLDLRTNAPEVLQEVATAISALPLDEQGAALAQFGSTGSKAIALLMGDIDKTTGDFKLLGTAIDTSDKAWKEGTGLVDSYAKSQQTMDAALSKLSASLDVAGQKAGTVLLPALTDLINVLTGGVQAAMAFGDGIGGIWDSIASGDASKSIGQIAGGDLLGGLENLLGYDINDYKASGKKTGDAIADGIKNSDALKNAPGDALGSETALDATKNAAKTNAEVFSDTQAAYIKSHSSGGYSLAQMAGEWVKIKNAKGELVDFFTGGMAGQASSDEDQHFNRQFEYLGKQFLLAMTETTQGDWSDVWTIGNARLSTTGMAQKKYDPLAAFEIATGLPHPAEGTAAYYRLIGNEMEAERVELREKLATPLTITSDSYLNFADNLKDEMAGAGEEINTAFLDGMTPDSASVESRLESIRRLKLYDPNEAKRQGADNAIAYLSALQDALDSYEKAKIMFLAEPDNENLKKTLDASLANAQAILGQNPLKVTVEADTRLLYTQVLDAITDLQGTALTLKLNELGISDPVRYTAYARDALTEELGKYSKTGQGLTPSNPLYTEFYELYKVLIDSYSSQNKRNQDLTWVLNAALSGDTAKWDEVFTMMGGKFDSSTEKITNAIGKSNDLLSKTAQNTEDLCEAMSDFGTAQEQSWDEMGMGTQGFIGNTADYNAFLTEEYQRGAYHPEPVQLGSMQSWKSEMEKYMSEVSGGDGITLPADVDTTKADASIAKIQEKAKEELHPPLSIDDSAAMATISGIDAAASRPVTKYVYVQEVGSGSGSSGGDNLNFDYGNPWAPPAIFPHYGIGDVFVPQPTLAVVGDRPGGEWIGGLDQASKKFGGGPTYNINATTNINAPVYGVEDLAQILDQNNRALVRQIADAQRGL